MPGGSVSAVRAVGPMALRNDVEVQEQIAWIGLLALPLRLAGLDRVLALGPCDPVPTTAPADPHELRSPPFDLAVIGRRDDLTENRDRGIPRRLTEHVRKVD